jgi:hypothetical protein
MLTAALRTRTVGCEASLRVLPTTANLIEALRQPRADGRLESYEALANRLPISMSTVNRWKRDSPEEWDTFVGLLDEAGWLDHAAISRDLARAAARAGAEADAVHSQAAPPARARGARKRP